jgi:hypothetical protein
VSDLDDLAARYVAVWNEPDPQARRAAIAELFAPDVAHYTSSNEVHGRGQMEERVAGSHEQWVKPGTHVFRSVAGADGHHSAARFNWEMVETASGKVSSVGFDFVTLTEDGLIHTDYQFIDG